LDWTPLEWAVESGDAGVVEFLLSKRARPSYSKRLARCALVSAVWGRDDEIASLVIGGSTGLQKTRALAFSAEQAHGYFSRSFSLTGRIRALMSWNMTLLIPALVLDPYGIRLVRSTLSIILIVDCQVIYRGFHNHHSMDISALQTTVI
jgi:ankyrin repeat protein